MRQWDQLAWSWWLQSYQSKKTLPKREVGASMALKEEDKSLASKHMARLEEGLAPSEGQSMAGLCSVLGLETNELSMLHGAALETDL